MAACISFTCQTCGFSVEHWDDGNPYVESPDGKRHHFHHPHGEEQLEKIVGGILGHFPSRDEIEKVLRTSSGNESTYLCTRCIKFSRRDPDRDKIICRHCGCGELVETGKLGGLPCPSCRSGVFDQGEMTAIS